MAAAPNITLATPITEIQTIPSQVARGLAALGVNNVGKLVAHLPMRHEQLEAETAVRELVPGQIVSARGEVVASRLVRHGRKPRFEAVLSDGTGRLDLVWFNQTYLSDRVQPGARLFVEGTARRFGPGGMGLQLVNPKHRVLRPDDEPDKRGQRVGPLRHPGPGDHPRTSRSAPTSACRVLPTRTA